MPKNIILATSIVALSLFNMSASLAAVGDRAKCYDKVIAVCNEGDHAESCAKTAMDACDKEHKELLVDPTKWLLSSPAPTPTTRQ
jgi:hypothetical protein